MSRYIPITYDTIHEHIDRFLHMKPKHHYEMSSERIEQYVNGLCYHEVRDVVRAILQNTRHVSFSYFLNVLRTLLLQCASKTSILERKIVIATAPSETEKKDYKSNQWLSCIAAPLFEPTDVMDLYIFEEDDIKTSILSGTTDFIVIDDASYSGDQLTKNITYLSNKISTVHHELKDELDRIEFAIDASAQEDAFIPPPPPPPMGAFGRMFGGGELEELKGKRDAYQAILDQEHRIHIIIPFYSTLAHKRVMEHVQALDRTSIKGEIYAGEHMKSIREVIHGDESFESIVDLVLAGTNNLKHEDEKHQTSAMDKILMYFDHKLADHISIPTTLIHGDVILHLLWRRAYETHYDRIIAEEKDEQKKGLLIKLKTQYTDTVKGLTPIDGDDDTFSVCGIGSKSGRSPIVPIHACQTYADKGEHAKCPSAFYKKNADSSIVEILEDETVWERI